MEKNEMRKRKNGVSIAEYAPHLVQYWHKDNVLGAHDVCRSSKFVAKWVCPNCGRDMWRKVMKAIQSFVKCSVCIKEKVSRGIMNFPLLLEEYCHDKNNTAVGDIGVYDKTKYWWRCKACGHEWQALVASRVKGVGRCKKCVPCKKKEYKCEKEISLLYKRPDLVELLVDESIRSIADTITCNSPVKVRWYCGECKGVSTSSIASKTNAKYICCAKCAKTKSTCTRLSRKVLVCGSLKDNCPAIAAEWHKDNDLMVGDVLRGSSYVAKWQCGECGHVWEQIVNERTRSKSKRCPKCNLTAPTPSLDVTHPHLIEYWGNPDSILNYTYGSDKMVMWQCKKCGHDWQQEIRTACEKKNEFCSSCRKSKPKPPKIIWLKCEGCKHEWRGELQEKCPQCSNESHKKHVTQKLSELLPQWEAYWHKDNNKEMSELFKSSNYKAKLICVQCGQVFTRKIDDYFRRRRLGVLKCRCNDCMRNNSASTSFPEQTIYFYIKQEWQDAQTRAIICGHEADVYIPSLKVCIEYDGQRFHKSEKACLKDEKKTLAWQQQGYRVIRMRENECPVLACKYEKVSVNPNKRTALQKATQELFGLLKIPVDVDLLRDERKIYQQYEQKQHTKSLLNYPHLVKEFMYERNGVFDLKTIFAGSVRKFWWKCGICGKEWLMAIKQRTAKNTKNTGCATCAKGTKLAIDAFPDIVKWWHVENKQKIEYLIASAATKFKFKCPDCSYEWRTSIKNIVKPKKTGICKQCKRNAKTKKIDN